MFGIKFAPLNIPLERRLQTLAAGSFFLMILLSNLIPFFCIYLVIFTSFRWMMILYLIWILIVDHDVCETGGRRIEWVRNWSWWKYAKAYFPTKLLKVPGVKLDPHQNYLFCCFPHGTLCSGPSGHFGSNHGEFKKLFPHHTSTILTIRFAFIIPFFRELILAVGACLSSKKSIEYLLSENLGGNVVALMVGGAEEAQYSLPGKYIFYYEKRKGFIKIAMKTGTPLVPVISFGETEIYTHWKPNRVIRFLQKIYARITGSRLILFNGRGYFQYNYGIIPRRHPIYTLVGFPMQIKLNLNPSDEEVDEIHKKFKEHLIQLFEENKEKYVENAENIHLEFI